jgi:hypothetical protein
MHIHTTHKSPPKPAGARRARRGRATRLGVDRIVLIRTLTIAVGVAISTGTFDRIIIIMSRWRMRCHRMLGGWWHLSAHYR